DLTWFFMLVLFLYVLLSWFSPDPRNPLVQLLTTIAVPILEPLRRVIPPVGGVIDLSPMIAIFALYILHDLLYGLLRYLVRGRAGCGEPVSALLKALEPIAWTPGPGGLYSAVKHSVRMMSSKVSRREIRYGVPFSSHSCGARPREL